LIFLSTEQVELQQFLRMQLKLSSVRQHRHHSVIAFTDGAVSEAGRGSSAVILIPLESGLEIEASQFHSTCTSSLEEEIEAIVFAMEQAANYFTVTTLKK